MYLRGQCASRMSCKQPRYGTYLQLLSDGSSFELIHTIPESIPTPGASCGPCGASGYYGGLIFDEINGVHGVSVDMHDTTVTSTACTWPSCSPEAPETSEDNVDAIVDTPDTAVASLQPGSGVTNANWASHCEMDPADQEIDAVHAGASALVAAVRAGHISPTVRTKRRLASQNTPPRKRKAQTASQHQPTRYPMVGYVTRHTPARAVRDWWDSVHSDIIPDVDAEGSLRREYLQDSASCGGATFMAQGASSEILTEIRDTDLNEDATWAILALTEEQLPKQPKQVLGCFS